MIEFIHTLTGEPRRDEFPQIDFDGGKTSRTRAMQSIVLAAIELFGNEPEWENATGGYYCRTAPNGAPRFIHVIGSVRPEKQEKYLMLCQEKAKRLALHEVEGHVTSWQSRSDDPDDLRYGGANRLADRDIDSFSGLPELGDEACCLVKAVAFGELEEEQARAFAAISSNPYFERLLAWMKQVPELPRSIFDEDAVEYLELGVRVSNCVKRALTHYRNTNGTLLTLVKIPRRDFKSYKGVGPKTLKEVEDRLSEIGLWFGMTDEEIERRIELAQ